MATPSTIPWSPSSNPFETYVDALMSGYRWSLDGSRVITYSFHDDKYDVLDIGNNQNDWEAWERQAIRNAFEFLETAINVDFRETTWPDGTEKWNDDGADIRLANYNVTWSGWGGDTDVLAHARLPDPDFPDVAGDIDVRRDGDGWNAAGLAPGGEGFYTITHEILHALGLQHPFNDNQDQDDLSFPNPDPYDDDEGWSDYATLGLGFRDGLDVGTFTIMSYTRGGNDAYGGPAGAMAGDIAALQWLYGARTTGGGGNSEYFLPDSNGPGTYFRTLWDVSGTDVISAFGKTLKATIDLRPGQFVSQLEGIEGGFTIAFDPPSGVSGAASVDVWIENAVGGANDDAIHGNIRANDLRGSQGNDTIDAYEGDDTVWGGSGNDNIEADWGDDVVHGEEDDDTIYGGDGADTIDGGAGADLLFGAAVAPTGSGTDAADSILGGAGNDTLGGGIGNDTLKGGDDQDLINGHADDDSIDGGNGNDELDGENGNDTILGGQNDADTLYGGAGNDSLDGGSGNDRLYGSNILGASALEDDDTLIGGAGLDSIWAAGGNDSILAGDGVDEVQGEAGDDTISGGAGGDVLRGGDDDDSIQGGAGADSLFGDAGADFIDGETENDTVDGGAGNDTIFGGSTDNDSLRGGSGNDSIDGGSGDDTINGGTVAGLLAPGETDHDTLVGGDGTDRLFGEEGDDHLDGGAGADTLMGGTGNDTYLLRGHETILETAADAADKVEAWVGFDTEIAGIEIFELKGDFANTAVGNSLANSLIGSSRGDRLEGRGGSDTLRGGAGDDSLQGGTGADLLNGNAGSDTYLDYDGLDTIIDDGPESDDLVITTVSAALGAFAGIEHLTAASGTAGINLTGDTKANRLTGNAGANRLAGGAGNDTLLGEAGKDTLLGGRGADTLYGGGDDDSLKGGDDDADLADFLHGDDGNDTLSGAGGHDTLIGGEGLDALFGGSGNDSLNGNIGDDVLDGGEGDDTLIGGALDNDTLRGGAGSDSLDGGSGDDIVDGGTGNDTVIGGEGIDLLAVRAGRSSADGGAGDSDRLIVNWAHKVRAAYLVADGYGTRFTDGYGDGDIAWFSGVEAFSITTGSGNDTLKGGALGDSLNGGAGNDHLDSVSGIDTVVGGAGNDRWEADLGAETTAIAINLAATFSRYLGTGLVHTIEMATLTTGSGNDVIATLVGLKHADRISLGAGDDRVTVGGGKDTVSGGDGSDHLIANYAHKVHSVSYVSDGYGTRFQDGYGDGDTVWFSGIERYTLLGGQAGDSFKTGAGDDVLAGNGGNDTLESGTGDDTVTGGAGNDYWIADQSARTGPVTVDLEAGLTAVSAYSGTATYFNIERLNLATGSGGDVIRTLGVAKHADRIETGDGDDTVTVGGGNDTVVAGNGIDHLIVEYGHKVHAVYYVSDGYGTRFQDGYGDGDFAWFSGIERFTVTTGKGNDSLRSGAANDVLRTGAGDDRIDSIGGVDTVDGGAGSDWWLSDLSDQDTAVVLDLTLADGTTTTLANGGTITSIERLNLVTGAGKDAITTLNVTKHADRIETGDGDDTVAVGGGNDTVVAGNGSDHLIANYGHKVHAVYYVSDGYGTRFQDGYGDGDAIWFSGIERFTVTTGSGNDTIRGGGDNDSLVTGGGNDDINGLAGIDTIDGGAGNDRWRGDLAQQSTRVVLNLAVQGVTQVLANGGTVRDIEALDLATGSGNDVIATLIGLKHADWISLGAGDDRATVGGGIDTVVGGEGSDHLIANYAHKVHGVSYVSDGYGTRFQDGYGDGDAVWFSGIERFTLIGGQAGDSFKTGAAADVVFGNAGDDVLDSGAGLDTVFGGDGTDYWIADKSALTGPVRVDLDAGQKAAVAYAGKAAFRGIERLDLATGSGNDVIRTLRVAKHADRVETGDGDDTVTVGGGNDTVVAGAGNDHLIINWAHKIHAVSYVSDGYGTRFQDGYGDGDAVWFSGIDRLTITTGSANDALQGSDGNDYLSGGAGNDSMSGGAGNDTYIVDSTSDEVSELPGQGTDMVRATASFTLGANVEHLLLLGIAGLDGTGNELANALTGNAGANTLDGLGGADTLRGGAGWDTYVVDSPADKVVELANQGIDTVRSSVSLKLGPHLERLELLGAANLNGTGNEVANALIGNAGHNILNGLGGADRMEGRAGNDTYIVDHAADLVIEAANEGIDSLRSTVSKTLFANVEKLTLLGAGNLNGTGNGLANTLIGNAGHNILNGAAGADTMAGGAGNDTYVVDNLGDRVFEAAGAGTDLVRSAVSFSLQGGFADHLTLLGAGHIAGTGNPLANRLVGNAGNNVLNGWSGNDTLTGAAGDDTFVFNAPLNATANVDTITDFSVADDTIRLENAVFTGLSVGVLAAEAFALDVASEADDRIVYASGTGALSFDADGSGAGAAVQFATLTPGLALTNADFLVV